MTRRRRISRGDGPAVHRYYDVPMESPSGQRVMYFEFDGEAIPGPGKVIVADRLGGNPREVAHVAGDCLGHVGAEVVWLDEQTICFAHRGHAVQASQILSLTDGARREFQGKIRSWHEHRRLALVMGRGAQEGADAFALNQRPDMDLFDPRTGEFRRLFSLGDAARAHPRGSDIDLGRMNFMNAKWAPDGQSFFVVFTDEVWCRRNARPRTIKSLILGRADGTGPRWLGEFTHHPMWAPSGEFILAHLQRGRGQDLVAYPLDTGRPEVLLPDFTGVHTMLDATGRQVVTDVYDDEQRTASVLVFDLSGGRCETVDRGRHERHDHWKGSHVHPQYSRDGKEVYYNLADSGAPQVYAVDL